MNTHPTDDTNSIPPLVAGERFTYLCTSFAAGYLLGLILNSFIW